jgi:hypothetical protein
MNTTIICPSCKKEIELTQALTHQIQEQVVAGEREKFETELQAIQKKLELAQHAELDLRKAKNVLEEEKRTFELDKQRQLDIEREKIRQKTLEEASESQRLKIKEYEKKLEDMTKAVEEAQRKASQGSQQLQGEVQELDMEQTFRSVFPTDTIEPIGKGVLGADIRQVVKSQRGTVCGSILWESKRTKAWSDGWVTKLKEDLRNDKANIPAIISEVLPEEAKSGMGLKDGVWVASPKLAVVLATLLRKSLIDAAYQKFVSDNRQTKAEQIYGYVTSHEFSQQVEAMVEVYQEMQAQISRERTAFEKSWKQREAQVNRLLSGVSGIYGSMQGIAGSALPSIKNLELSDIETADGNALLTDGKK